ncbi:MAG: type IV toxin-antitoxin system AbiEi family antitoxin domain-containing protein [Actinomycetota bacterium]
MESKTVATPGAESPGTVDRTLARLAERQHGVVARRQLFALGLGPRTIERRIARERLHRIHRGVYAVGHRSLSAHGHWLAAVLAAGPGAVLSHRSAAALWELRPAAGSRIDVTVRARARRSRPRIAIHVTRDLRDRDRVQRAGIPVTSVARTLLDLGGMLSEAQLARAVEEAERLDRLDLRAIDDVCLRGRGRRGLGALLGVLADHSDPVPLTRSELERAFLDLCHEHRLPLPRVNHFIAGFEVDAVWLGQRLVVELDGYAFHRTRGAFERDRARDAALLLAGYRVLRFTHRRLEREPAGDCGDGASGAGRAHSDKRATWGNELAARSALLAGWPVSTSGG